MIKKMTVEDVKEYLSVLNKGRKLVEIGSGTFEVRMGDDQLVRREEFDQEATDKMNRHLQQPGRCLVFKTTFFNTQRNPNGYKCYFFDDHYFFVGRLFNEGAFIYTQVPCYISFPDHYELQPPILAETTREWFKQQMKWFAAESHLFRLSLVTGALSFAEDRTQ